MHKIGFLCPLSANRYNVEFVNFKIDNYTTKETLFQISDGVQPVGIMEMDMEYDGVSFDEDNFRTIKYTFNEDVLRLPLISTL